MSKEKAFNNFKHNGIHLTFPNRNMISTIWGVGSYTENHDIDFKNDDLTDMFNTFLESNNVEVMISCGKKLKKRLHKKFGAEEDGGSPHRVIGYLSIMEWLYIVNKVANEKKD